MIYYHKIINSGSTIIDSFSVMVRMGTGLKIGTSTEALEVKSCTDTINRVCTKVQKFSILSFYTCDPIIPNN